MYRATPLTYYIEGIMATALSDLEISCLRKDLVELPETANGTTCGEYLSSYVASHGASILNPDATKGCLVCLYGCADSLLAQYGMFYDHRWIDWGITICYNVFNIGCAFLLYRLLRASKGARKEKESEKQPEKQPEKQHEKQHEKHPGVMSKRISE